MCEGDLTDQLLKSLFVLVAQSNYKFEVGEDVLAGLPLLVGKVPQRHILLRTHLVLLAAGVDVVPALQLPGDGFLQQPAALRDDRTELVADSLVHRRRLTPARS